MYAERRRNLHARQLVRLQHTYFEYENLDKTPANFYMGMSHIRDLERLNARGELKIPKRATSIQGTNLPGIQIYLQEESYSLSDVIYQKDEDLIKINGKPVYFTNPTLRQQLKDIALYRKLCDWRGQKVYKGELECIFQSYKDPGGSWKSEIHDEQHGVTKGEIAKWARQEIATPDVSPDLACGETQERCMEAVETFEDIPTFRNKALPCFAYVDKPMWFFTLMLPKGKPSTRDNRKQQFVYFYPHECEIPVTKACVLHTFTGFNIVTPLSEASYNVGHEVIIDTAHVNTIAHFGRHATLNNTGSGSQLARAALADGKFTARLRLT